MPGGMPAYAICMCAGTAPAGTAPLADAVGAGPAGSGAAAMDDPSEAGTLPSAACVELPTRAHASVRGTQQQHRVFHPHNLIPSADPAAVGYETWSLP
jgi:hypothetical protein